MLLAPRNPFLKRAPGLPVLSKYPIDRPSHPPTNRQEKSHTRDPANPQQRQSVNLRVDGKPGANADQPHPSLLHNASGAKGKGPDWSIPDIQAN
jgi:hypothetical protein